MTLPVIMQVALLVAGSALPPTVVRGGLIGAAAGLALLAAFIAALASESFTRSLGQALNRVLRPLGRRITFLREVTVEELVSDQQARIVSVMRHGWNQMTFGMISFFVVRWLCALLAMLLRGRAADDLLAHVRRLRRRSTVIRHR